MTRERGTQMADDKDKALDIALGQIEKQFGKGSIMRLGENLHMNVEKIPTGSLALDMALGIGGLPRGRIDIRRIEAIKDGTEVVGNRTRAKIVKNKVASPFKQAEFDIMYGKGISKEGSLLDVSVELGIVKKAGAWFTYEGEQLGQGRENVKTFLMENPMLIDEIDARVRERLSPTEPEVFAPMDDEPISID